MKFKTTKPVAAKTITITLTPEEAGLLALLVGRVGGGYEMPLSLRGLDAKIGQKIREKVTSPIFDALSEYRPAEYRA